MRKPKTLKPGDCVAVIAPAGPPDEKKVAEGIRCLENLGLRVVMGNALFHKEGYLAAPDQERLRDLHQAFSDPSIRAVFCARGGYGTARIAPFIDYECIRSNPKIFWGYSDVTYLHGAIQKYSGLVTFHGPMVASDLNREAIRQETYRSFLQLFHPTIQTFDYSIAPLNVLAIGRGEGKIVGGNLTLMTDALGTPYEWEVDGGLLMIEEVNEPAYRVGAMLQHMNFAGVFERVNGVILGDFKTEGEEKRKVEKLLEQFFADAPFPVVGGLPVGHCRPNYGIPLGVRARLSTSPPCLQVDSGVI
ncbi:LD-carboxypeptidase [Halobacillus fulvus]|nr:LD-carboxypeptidase [Halobacillus fulvus]